MYYRRAATAKHRLELWPRRRTDPSGGIWLGL
jgi:hypothetical protein